MIVYSVIGLDLELDNPGSNPGSIIDEVVTFTSMIFSCEMEILIPVSSICEIFELSPKCQAAK